MEHTKAQRTVVKVYARIEQPVTSDQERVIRQVLGAAPDESLRAAYMRLWKAQTLTSGQYGMIDLIFDDAANADLALDGVDLDVATMLAKNRTRIRQRLGLEKAEGEDEGGVEHQQEALKKEILAKFEPLKEALEANKQETQETKIWEKNVDKILTETQTGPLRFETAMTRAQVLEMIEKMDAENPQKITKGESSRPIWHAHAYRISKEEERGVRMRGIGRSGGETLLSKSWKRFTSSQPEDFMTIACADGSVYMHYEYAYDYMYNEDDAAEPGTHLTDLLWRSFGSNSKESWEEILGGTATPMPAVKEVFKAGYQDSGKSTSLKKDWILHETEKSADEITLWLKEHLEHVPERVSGAESRTISLCCKDAILTIDIQTIDGSEVQLKNIGLLKYEADIPLSRPRETW
jgi:hypothetical protein